MTFFGRFFPSFFGHQTKKAVLQLGAEKMKTRNSLLYGLAGFFGLLLLFFGILSIANSPGHALQQFLEGWYWILALSLGFGTQIGLYVWMQNQLIASALLGKEVAATTTVSGASMVACCAHHLTDVLPLLGLGAAALFFSQYQSVFIAIGIFSNLLGIIFMLQTSQKHGILGNHFLLARFQNWNLNQVFWILSMLGVLTVLASAWLVQ